MSAGRSTVARPWLKMNSATRAAVVISVCRMFAYGGKSMPRSPSSLVCMTLGRVIRCTAVGNAGEYGPNIGGYSGTATGIQVCLLSRSTMTAAKDRFVADCAANRRSAWSGSVTLVCWISTRISPF
jgi:hypothetical protein